LKTFGPLALRSSPFYLVHPILTVEAGALANWAMQLMRCNHCPFGSLGRFLQLLQRRLFGPFGPRTEFSMGSMWNVTTCSIERAQFFIPLARRDAGIVRHPRCRGRGGLPQPRSADFHLGNLHPSMAPPSFM